MTDHLHSLERLELIQWLSGLPGGEFDKITFALNPPPGIIPGSNAPVAEKAKTLLDWLESPSGKGLASVLSVGSSFNGFPLLSTQGGISEPRQRVSFSEAPQIQAFYGREKELSELRGWIVDEECSLVALLGIGGIGKSTLSVKLSQEIQEDFDFCIWRSLKYTPPLNRLLTDLINLLSNQQEYIPSKDTNESVERLVSYFQRYRCLLVLDNLESIFQDGAPAGQYLSGFEAYGKLIKRIGESCRGSCLLITSREKPREVAMLEGKKRPARSFTLQGLEERDGANLLNDFGWENIEISQVKRVINYYGGNPLALSIVANTIQEMFRGDVDEFFKHRVEIFGEEIWGLLEQQFNRLSNLGQSIMYWLTINREPINLSTLKEDIIEPIPKKEILETLVSLSRRSLIESTSNGFTLQNFVMEYVLDRFIESICEDFNTQETNYLRQYSYLKAQEKDYIREAQSRLILTPILNRLLDKDNTGHRFRKKAREALKLLKRNTNNPPSNFDYGVGNIINLLLHSTEDLKDYDFSGLAIQNAYFAKTKINHVNFSNSHFSGCAFIENFGSILSVSFSPSGNLLATGDAKGEIRIWDIRTGQLLHKLNRHTSWVWSVIFIDEDSLVSGSADKLIKIWDVKTGECTKSFPEKVEDGHHGWIRTVAISSDKKTLASGGQDKLIKLWNLRTGKCLETLEGHSNILRSVSFSPDGKFLASCGPDGTIKVWNLTNGLCIATLQDDTDWLWSVSFSPDGSRIASGCKDQTVRIWDWQSKKCIQTLRSHTEQVRTVVFSPNGELVASGSDDKTIKIWSISTGQCIKTLFGHSDWIFSISFDPASNLLASGGDDQTLRIWDIESGQCLKTFKGFSHGLWSIALSPSGTVLASAGEDKILRLWDIEAGQCVSEWEAHDGQVWSVAFHPSGQILASCSDDSTIALHDISNIKRPKKIKIIKGHTYRVKSVVFTPTGDALISSSGDFSIRVWDLISQDREPIVSCSQVIEGHSNGVYSAVFSQNGKHFVSCSCDQTLKKWNLNTGKCFKTFEGHTRGVETVKFSPDDSLLASGGGDRKIRIWNPKTSECLLTLEGHAGGVRTVAFAPSSDVLVSGSEDKTIKIWDIDKGKCIRTLEGHSNWVTSALFSKRGELITASQDGTIKFWDIDRGQCLRTLKVPRPYEGTNITGCTGLTEAQKIMLKELGAVENYG